jgi:sec-independent protein translocase protein TatA
MNLGMSEMLLILVVALIVFGPRKLPELGKSLGQAMSQFRRASEDFKRSWEQEVELERTRNPITAENAYNSTPSEYHLPEESSQLETTASSGVTHEPAVAGSPAVAETPRSEHWI